MTDRRIPFATNMVKVCWFTTLRDLGYRTHLAVQSPLRLPSGYADSLNLTLDLFDNEGSRLLAGSSLGILNPGCRAVIQIDDQLESLQFDGDAVGVLHMTPSRLLESDCREISLEEINLWTAACDEFVGYTHTVSGIASGVHYQSPPMNDSRIRSSQSVIIQSPKVVVNEWVDSHLLVFSPSSDPDFDATVGLAVATLLPNGDAVARLRVDIPARGRRKISVSELLESNGALDRFRSAGGCGMLVGLTTGGVVTPLSLVHDSRGGLAVDHTLPPPYYVPWWGGDVRKRSSRALVDRIFPPRSDS